jgi:hypothetical protein
MTNWGMSYDTPISQFYKHKDYAATYYAIYVALERWIAAQIFRSDITRVFLASEEYAFRRRFELTDTSQDYNNINFSSLNLPFANYWPGNAGWVPDDRVAANPYALVKLGISARTRMLRAMMVKTTIPLTCYFDRDDDARMAYERLLHLSYIEERPVTTIGWKGETIQIPVFIKIQNLTFNPTYKENDWLKQNKVYIIKADIELRSFSITPPEQPIYSNTDPLWEDDEKFYLTEDVILYLKSNNKITSELQINSTFNENPSITIDQFAVVSSTFNSARLVWAYHADNTITSAKLHVDGLYNIDLPLDSKEITIRDLKEESTYTLLLELADDKGITKVVSLRFTTPASLDTARKKAANPDTLVGVSW